MKKKNVFRYVNCLFLLIFALVMFVACASENFADEAADERIEEVLDRAEETEMDVDWEEDESESADMMMESSESEVSFQTPEEEERALGSIPILLPSESGRQLVYTVAFNIETTEFTRGMRLILDSIAELEGYSERVTEHGRSLHQPSAERYADFSVRIPNENLLNFIKFIDNNLEIYNRVFFDKELADLTFTYEGNEANLETLREQEQRISDELDHDGIEEPDVTQDDLDEVRAQIRRLEETNTIIEQDVDYSHVSIRLSEVILPEEEIEEEPATFGEQLQATFDGAIGTLLTILQIAVLITVAVLPWALMIACIVVPIVYAVKKRERKKAKEKKLDE